MTDWGEVFPAPAKLNLFLHVIGRRDDGYHLLQSAFRLIDRCDALRFERRRDAEIRRVTDTPGVPPDSDLVVRAARLLQAQAAGLGGLEIHLEKRLPMGGGLGGGSSDAATTLIALNQLWGLDLSRQDLAKLGLELGADVPFFIFGQNAFVEGIGERLAALPLAHAWYVVIEPGVSVPTARVFADPKLTRNSKAIKIADFSAGWGGNDLQVVVCAHYPEVGAAIAWLAQHGPARMTGSGSCVFAEFDTKAHAVAVVERVPSRWRAWVASGLARHPLHAITRD